MSVSVVNCMYAYGVTEIVIKKMLSVSVCDKYKRIDTVPYGTVPYVFCYSPDLRHFGLVNRSASLCSDYVSVVFST